MSVSTETLQSASLESSIRISQSAITRLAGALLALLGVTNDVVRDFNIASDEVWWNENLHAVFGYGPGEAPRGKDGWVALIHPRDRARVERSLAEGLDAGESVWTGEYRFRRKDGSYAYVFDRGLVMRDVQGRAVRMIGAMMDLSARKKAKRRAVLLGKRQELVARFGQRALDERNFDALMREAVGVVCAGGADAAAVIESFGSTGQFALRAASGEELEPSNGVQVLASPDSKLHQVAGSEGILVAERAYFASRPDHGPWGWLRNVACGAYAPVRGESTDYGILAAYSRIESAFDGEFVRFLAALGNVLSSALQRQRAEARFKHLAQFDTVTGLPNRPLLQETLGHAIAQARRRDGQAAVLFVDLDRFKLVNDTLGHQAGDELLAQASRRLAGCLRAGDTLGRISGDEFAAVLVDLARADDAAVVAQRLLDALGRPFGLGGHDACVTASVGIASFPGDGASAEALLKNADAAMDSAKASSRNAYRFFTEELNARAAAMLQLATDLRNALERKEFELHYQPKVELATGRLVGMEALMRWPHPQRGMVSPAEFIPALEETGLIVAAGNWVIEEACRQLRGWLDQGLDLVPVAVNLSVRQFRRHDLDTAIRRMLAEHEISPELLELEITESCLMEDPGEAVRQLRALREAGVRITVDDFGTGYSSLAYLTQLPLSTLKIDRGFVSAAMSNPSSAMIVKAVIDLARNLRFSVVAEGIETVEQVEFLRQQGCEQGQGYLFGKPMPATEIAPRLRCAHGTG